VRFSRGFFVVHFLKFDYNMTTTRI
jgi:hypothetical protein